MTACRAVRHGPTAARTLVCQSPIIWQRWSALSWYFAASGRWLFWLLPADARDQMPPVRMLMKREKTSER